MSDRERSDFRNQIYSHFENSLRGSLIRPGNKDYDSARSIWNGMIDRKPRMIVRCKGAADVISSVNFARIHNLPVSVRGGGHHVAGHAVCDDGLMIDLSLMDQVHVDPSSKIARVGPGATIRNLDHETQAFGLVTTGAPVTMVGVAGYTLGGGLGWTSRKHGLACDNLISADIVTAEGELVHASETENPDLFWGLRGGSGNFGIVTSFTFQLHELGPKVLAGPIVHPIQATAELLKFWREYMTSAPDELQCMPIVFQNPENGDPVFCLYPLYAGDPSEGKKVIQPLRNMGEPLSDEVDLVPYAGLLEGLDEMYQSGHRNYYRSAFFDTIPNDAMNIIAEKSADVPTPFSSLFLEPMGGAIAEKDIHATAFPHRKRKFCLTAVPKWEHAKDDAKMIAWADNLLDALEPYSEQGVYVNYLNDISDEHSKRAYSQHWDRLRSVKKKWDPHNFFNRNHNISPK